MSSLNRVDLIGNLGADPVLNYTQSGVACCNFRLATNERWTDKNGQKQERTEWHRIVVWGKLGEVCNEYLSKGRQVFVSGSLQTRQWEDRDGVTRYTTEIRARDVTFLGSKGDNNVAQKNNVEQAEEEVPQAELNVGETPFG